MDWFILINSILCMGSAIWQYRFGSLGLCIAQVAGSIFNVSLLILSWLFIKK
jgi:hypothetical protein